MSEKLNIEQLAKDYENKSPREILELALNNFKNIAISFSGAEDVVLIDMARRSVMISGYFHLIQGASILRHTSSSRKSGRPIISRSKCFSQTAMPLKSW